MNYRQLGKTGLLISPIGLGCWQFSKQNGLVGGFWKNLNDTTVHEIVQVSLKTGINWFDTAEVYGWGASERSLIDALIKLEAKPESIHIADKWWPVFRSASSIPKILEKQLNRMDGFSISLYQIHNPLSRSSLKSQLNRMADALEEKKIKTIGVSNFTAGMMESAYKILENRNLTLASNQVKYHLLDRKIENNGVLKLAKDLGITIIAYSPLAQGLLTGKFHKDFTKIKDRPGPRKWQGAFKEKGLKKTLPLIELLEKIGNKYDKTAAQVALNWTINAHGETVVAIPGASSLKQAEDNGKSMSFLLTEEELDQISKFTEKK